MYSSLTGEHVTQNVYENAKKIRETFEIKNMRDFTILYNKIDVLLLTDVMENYGAVSLRDFKLDPVYYYTTPGFAWNAMLRKTGVKLELLKDTDMYLMFEQGIREGLSQSSIIYSKANNKYIGEREKKKHQRNISQIWMQIISMDGRCVNIYHTKGFKWCNPDLFNTENFFKMKDDQEKSYIFEEDMKYPEELHDLHSDYSLTPENVFDNTKLLKLTMTLYDKKKYILHYIILGFI
ncbi:Hypothetical protein CINCED_3A014561 [Cinara cedri]|uniref:Uncharacterized protein n=1 Tax=Cinara cedri TaxID=506608 RepID=A0A5E4MLT5_9HEMI|nr:Hypothetical protein CINCED_3A014561 [Cinara cedri]